MSLQTQIRSCRKKRRITQKQLGDIIGVTDSAVRLWELGMRIPTVEKLQALSDYFGISTDELLDTEDKAPGISVGEVKFRKTFGNLSPQGQKEILDFLDYVRDKEERLQAKEAETKKNS